jgi:hypothetical protein
VTPRPAGPRTLVGVDSDTLGTPVDSAEIFIASLKRRVMSAPDGSFRVDDIKPGTTPAEFWQANGSQCGTIVVWSRLPGGE